jgi:hypothetical protein
MRNLSANDFDGFAKSLKKAFYERFRQAIKQGAYRTPPVFF